MVAVRQAVAAGTHQLHRVFTVVRAHGLAGQAILQAAHHGIERQVLPYPGAMQLIAEYQADAVARGFIRTSGGRGCGAAPVAAGAGVLAAGAVAAGAVAAGAPVAAAGVCARTNGATSDSVASARAR